MRHALSNHRSSLATIASWAMFSRGLEPEFPDAVHKQLSHLTGAAVEAGSHIRDLTALPWCSIDNDDSRDLDQLTAIEPLGVRGVRVFVAVADVDALVKKGSPIDEYARHNTTSVYTSARVFPMLPERLCTDLTSLNPDQDRLAVVTEMSFSDDGMLVDSSIYRALVRNKVQLAYDAVSAWIEGEGEMPEPARGVEGMGTQLRLQDALAQKLRVLRRAQGSLEFETFQPKALFAGDRIADIRQQAQNRARQLIEELMIATNGCTARFLAAQGSASLRRVVRSPERWQRIVEVAQGYGATLPRQPDGKALEAFLAQQHQADPLRFPDLITLRLLKAALAGEKPPYSNEELDELASHCTAQEDAAQKVERQVRKSEAALLLHSRIGQQFDALVTGASGKGAWVRIFQPPAEGRLKGELPALRVGQLVRVQLVSTSVERGFIDFVLTQVDG